MKHSETSLGRVAGDTRRKVKKTAEKIHGVHKGLPSGETFGADFDCESKIRTGRVVQTQHKGLGDRLENAKSISACVVA